jgi:hypothetical protein
MTIFRKSIIDTRIDQPESIVLVIDHIPASAQGKIALYLGLTMPQKATIQHLIGVTKRQVIGIQGKVT